MVQCSSTYGQIGEPTSFEVDILYGYGVARRCGEGEGLELRCARFEQGLLDLLFERDPVAAADVTSNVELLQRGEEREVFQQDAQFIGPSYDDGQGLKARKMLLAEHELTHHVTIEFHVLDVRGIDLVRFGQQRMVQVEHGQRGIGQIDRCGKRTELFDQTCVTTFEEVERVDDVVRFEILEQQEHHLVGKRLHGRHVHS